jgi:hypothetical protein
MKKNNKKGKKSCKNDAMKKTTKKPQKTRSNAGFSSIFAHFPPKKTHRRNKKFFLSARGKIRKKIAKSIKTSAK